MSDLCRTCARERDCDIAHKLWQFCAQRDCLARIGECEGYEIRGQGDATRESSGGRRNTGRVSGDS